LAAVFEEARVNSRAHRLAPIVVVAALIAACGNGQPTKDSLKDAFAQQLGTNKFVKDFARNGDEMTFTGPGADGGTAKWRVHIDLAVIEDTESQSLPYKGIIESSWYSDNRLVKSHGRDSMLPIELTANGLAQECWAYWDRQGKRWSWEE
jgi:hypothetical protein